MATKIKRLLKDVILAEVLDNTPKSSIIYIPETAKSDQRELMRVLILEVGTKFRYKDEVGIGHTVWVPKNFGNKLDKFDEHNIRMFDGEDVYAVEQ